MSPEQVKAAVGTTITDGPPMFPPAFGRDAVIWGQPFHIFYYFSNTNELNEIYAVPRVPPTDLSGCSRLFDDIYGVLKATYGNSDRPLERVRTHPGHKGRFTFKDGNYIELAFLFDDQALIGRRCVGGISYKAKPSRGERF
jgi:hypothetical protein